MLLSLIAIILSGTGGLDASRDSSPNLSPFDTDPKWPQCAIPVSYDTYSSNAPQFTQLFGTVVDIISSKIVKHIQQCSQHCSYELDCRFIYLSSYEEGADCIMGRKLIPYPDQSSPCVTNQKDPVVYGISEPGEAADCFDKTDTLKDRQNALIYNKEFLISEDEASEWIARSTLSTTSVPRVTTAAQGIPTGSQSSTPHSSSSIIPNSTSGPGTTSSLGQRTTTLDGENPKGEGDDEEKNAHSKSTSADSAKPTTGDLNPSQNRSSDSPETVLSETLSSVNRDATTIRTSESVITSSSTSLLTTTTTPKYWPYHGIRLPEKVKCPTDSCACTNNDYLIVNTTNNNYISGKSIRQVSEKWRVYADNENMVLVGDTIEDVSCRNLEDYFNKMNCHLPPVKNGFFGTTSIQCPNGIKNIFLFTRAMSPVQTTEPSTLQCVSGGFRYKNEPVSLVSVVCM